MRPSEIFESMSLLSYQLTRITHGSDFKQWDISLPAGAAVRAGAPIAAQPPLRIEQASDLPIDPVFPVSVQVLDPLERGGNNHAAARRRLGKWMAGAGFTEAGFSESPHSMQMVFVSENCSLPLEDWLTSVPPLQPDFEVVTKEAPPGPRDLNAVQLRELNFSNNPPPPTDERLDELEQRWKLQLPDDYYVFLLKYNGGVPNPSTLKFTSSGDEKELKILQFLSLFPPEQFSPYDLEAALETQPTALPKHLLPMAYCEFEGEPHRLCLSFIGEERGKIILFEEYADDPCREVAASITALLEQLHD